jgi:phosphohistidine phosphatase
MKLYFLRHGQANWEHWDKPDEERPLTKKGRKEVSNVAEALREIKARPALIVTSPLPRASETAQLVAEELEVDCITAPTLAPGFDLPALKQILNEHAEQDVLLVGHEPDFSHLISLLTGGTVKLTKAGLARVDLENITELRGELVWLLTPKVMKEI